MRSNMEDIMHHLQIIIITSGDKYSAEEWKDMEADIMQILKTTEEYGGMNIRLEKNMIRNNINVNNVIFELMEEIIYGTIKEEIIVITSYCVNTVDI